MSRWFRWYDGSCEDGKFRMVARNAEVTVATVIGVWAIILEDASHVDHRGIAVRREDFYAAILDISEDDVQHILQFMEEIELISVGHGEITVTNWKERQFETDTTDPTNADRQRRWREKHKSNSGETKHNATITDAKRPETETETETETEKKEHTLGRSQKKPQPKYSEEFDQFRQAYPRRLGADPKKPAFQVFQAAMKQGTDPQAIIEGAKRCAIADSDKIGTPYIPQAVKWLRDRRWEDYTSGPAGEKIMSDDDRQKLFTQLRGSNGQTAKDSNVRGSGDGPRESEGARRQEPTSNPDDQTTDAGMGRLAPILRRMPGL